MSSLSKSPTVQKRNELLASKIRSMITEGKTIKEIAETLNYSVGFLYLINRHYNGGLYAKKPTAGQQESEQGRAFVRLPLVEEPIKEPTKPPVEAIITEPAIAAFLYMNNVPVVRLQFDPNHAGRVVFIYHQTEELDRLIAEYLNNERMVYPQEFSKATRYIFHTIKDFQNHASGRYAYGQANTL